MHAHTHTPAIPSSLLASPIANLCWLHPDCISDDSLSLFPCDFTLPSVLGGCSTVRVTSPHTTFTPHPSFSPNPLLNVAHTSAHLPCCAEIVLSPLPLWWVHRGRPRLFGVGGRATVLGSKVSLTVELLQQKGVVYGLDDRSQTMVSPQLIPYNLRAMKGNLFHAFNLSPGGLLASVGIPWRIEASPWALPSSVVFSLCACLPLSFHFP